MSDDPNRPSETGASRDASADAGDDAGDDAVEPTSEAQPEWEQAGDDATEDIGGGEEWQEPVSYDEYEQDERDERDDAEPEEGWDPDPGPVAPANGAAGRYSDGRGTGAATGPRPQRPPGRRPAAAPARRPSLEKRRRDEGGGDEESEGDGEGRHKVAPKQKRQVLILSLLTVLVVGVGIAGFILSRGASETGQEAIDGGGGPSTTVRPGATIPAADMQPVHDPVTNFNIKVPKTWNPFTPPVADVRLVMGAGENDGLSVRVLPIQTPATVDNIGNFKVVTDNIVFGDRTAKLIQEQLIRVNNNLAYHYIYTFTDAATGQEGVHAHYFIFEGNRMFSVVFQTIPTQDFVRLAPVFDQVAESITIGPAPAQPTTTTTP